MQSGGQSATSWASFLANWNDAASNCFTGDGDRDLVGDLVGDSILFLILFTISLGGLDLRFGSISPVDLYAELPGTPFETRIRWLGLLAEVLWITGGVLLLGGVFCTRGGEISLDLLHSHRIGFCTIGD